MGFGVFQIQFFDLINSINVKSGIFLRQLRNYYVVEWRKIEANA